MAAQNLFISMENQTFLALFKPLEFVDSLPFPLNCETTTIILITVYLSLNLLFGSLLRFKILMYAKSLSVKENPINLFIWYDQLIGIFMAMNITYTLTLIHLPFPLASIIGDAACNWTDLMGNLYLVSQAVWSFCIAIYRTLYIKFHWIFKNGIKESKFAFILSLTGSLYIISSAGFIAYHDKGILYKLCSHHSLVEVEISNVSINLLHLYVTHLSKVLLH
jgi:hypothetical protein